MRNMRRHKGAENRAVITYAQVQQLVNDDDVLDDFLLRCEVCGERNRSRRRARSPLPAHRLNAHGARPERQPDGPMRDPLTKPR